MKQLGIVLGIHVHTVQRKSYLYHYNCFHYCIGCDYNVLEDIVPSILAAPFRKMRGWRIITRVVEISISAT